MIFALFVLVLFADFILFFGVVFSIFFPDHRIWPPPKKDSWQFWVSWIFSVLRIIGSPLVGIFDFGSLGNGNMFRFFMGGPLIVIGLFIAFWGMVTLSTHQSLGLKGKLVTKGPYRYSRNPQYVGAILFYVGFILVTYSLLGLVVEFIVASVFVILPFSEEPWLRQQYGKNYVAYYWQVPRFLGFRSFKPKTFSD